MGFKRIETGIENLIILEPDVFGDPRGFFMETYNQQAFEGLGLTMKFVQDNLSFSTKGILRGLHFQAPPFAQGKLVTVLRGEVLDVAVDIRKNSATYGKAFSLRLSAENHRIFYVPPGFAHGFQVLSEDCLFSYKCTGLYNKSSEGGLSWDDPALGIDWPIKDPLLSEKDRVYPKFEDFSTPFN